MKCTVDNVFSAKVDTIIRRLRPLERAKRKWNHLELSGTIWNARRATGTAAGSGTREAQLERRRLLERALAPLPLTLKCVNFVNFVNFL